MKKNLKTFQVCNGNRLRHAFLLVLFGFLTITLPARNPDTPANPENHKPPVTVTGTVTDSKNIPLEGVSVFVKGTKKGVITNAQGSFTIKDVPENSKLVFTYTGYFHHRSFRY